MYRFPFMDSCLRRDETLASLEGKEIEGEGILRKGQFIMSAWKTLG